MSANNEYKRYFIILQEDDKGYELSSGKIPTGYVKIETKSGKSKLTAFIQNVKNNEKNEYRFILVAPGKKAGIDLGKIILDKSGRGELYHEFDADNVLRSSIEISEFTVAAVSSSNGIPLSGYIGRDKLNWKNSYEILNRNEANRSSRGEKGKLDIEEIIAPIQKQPNKKEEIAPETKDVKEVIEEQQPIMEQLPIKQEEMQAPVTIEKTEIYIEAQPVKKQAPVVQEKCKYEYYYKEEEEEEAEHHHTKCDKCKHEEKKKSMCDDYDKHPYYSSNMYRRLKKIISKLRKCEPFEDKEKDCEWYKVEDDIYMLNSASIPFMGTMMPLGCPYMMEDCIVMIGQKDYILGVKYNTNRCDDKKYIKCICFGVPGTYSKMDEMNYKMKGYMNFRPHKSKKYGYWIMCVDLNTGKIVK